MVFNGINILAVITSDTNKSESNVKDSSTRYKNNSVILLHKKAIKPNAKFYSLYNISVNTCYFSTFKFS